MKKLGILTMLVPAAVKRLPKENTLKRWENVGTKTTSSAPNAGKICLPTFMLWKILHSATLVTSPSSNALNVEELCRTNTYLQMAVFITLIVYWRNAISVVELLEVVKLA